MFATLAGRSISVAAKGLKARVDSPDPVGISAPQLMWSFDGQWTVVSGGIRRDGVRKPERRKVRRLGTKSGREVRGRIERARIGLNKHDERIAHLT